jgi:tetratricopeptide (TPR) repeat protein
VYSRDRRRIISLTLLAVVSTGLHAEDSKLDPRHLLEQSTERLIASMLESAHYYQLASRNDASLALLEAGLDICNDTNAPMRCSGKILNGLGRTLSRAGRYDDATANLEQARDLAAEAGDDLTQAAALNALGNNLLRQEEFEIDRIGDRMTAVHQDALAIYRRLERESNEGEFDAVWAGIGESLFQLAFLDESRGRIDQAEAQYRECAEAAERGSNQIILGFCMRHLGYLAVSAGEIDEAEDLFGRSLEARKAGGSVAGTGFAMNTLGQFLYEQRADPASAIVVLEEGLALMESTDEYAGMAAILLTLATIHNDEGRANEANDYARRCLDVARANDVTFVIARAEQLLAATRAPD